MNLAPQEVEIIGSWLFDGNRTVGDASCQRIKQLIAGPLQKLGTDASGWETLYRDPADGRFWELTYPMGEMQGGGPTKLAWISRKNAGEKHPLLDLPPPNGTW